MANCPNCRAPVTYVDGSGIEVRVMLGKTWNGIAYSCPSCSTVLACEIDPIAVKNDTAKAVTDNLVKVVDAAKREIISTLANEIRRLLSDRGIS